MEFRDQEFETNTQPSSGAVQGYYKVRFWIKMKNYFPVFLWLYFG